MSLADFGAAFMTEVSVVFNYFLFDLSIEICLHRIVIMQYMLLHNAKEIQIGFLILLRTMDICWTLCITWLNGSCKPCPNIHIIHVFVTSVCATSLSSSFVNMAVTILFQLLLDDVLIVC